MGNMVWATWIPNYRCRYTVGFLAKTFRAALLVELWKLPIITWDFFELKSGRYLTTLILHTPARTNTPGYLEPKYVA